MTNKQMKLCKIIRKEKLLTRILSKSGVPDYNELQYEFDRNALEFSDSNMDDQTTVALGARLLEELEERERSALRERVTWILSICAIIISIIALFRP